MTVHERAVAALDHVPIPPDSMERALLQVEEALRIAMSDATEEARVLALTVLSGGYSEGAD